MILKTKNKAFELKWNILLWEDREFYEKHGIMYWYISWFNYIPFKLWSLKFYERIPYDAQYHHIISILFFNISWATLVR